MPPRTAWEWLEAYGPLQTDPDRIHGSWAEARQEAAVRLEAVLPRQTLDDMLAETKEAFALQPAEEVVSRGSGWGAVEKARCAGNEDFAPQLDFDSPDESTGIWHTLLRTGAFPPWDMKTPPPSYMVQEEFLPLVEKAPVSPLRDFQLGLNRYFRGEFEEAEKCFRRAGDPRGSFAVAYALGNARRSRGDFAGAVRFFEEGFASLDPTCIREGLQCCCEAGAWQTVLDCYEALPETLKRIAMNKVYYIEALVRTGRPEEAEALLMEGGGIDVPQLREGEGSLSILYAAIQCAKGKKQEIEVDPDTVEIPEKLDFRMNHINSELGRYGARHAR